jgi:hypothetical protein
VARARVALEQVVRVRAELGAQERAGRAVPELAEMPEAAARR